MALPAFSRICQSLLHDPNKRVLCGAFQSGWIENCLGAKRYLLTDDVIRLGDFQQQKLLAKHGTISNEKYVELFKERLQENKRILQDELKKLLHLCNSADDMVVARDAIYWYHEENRNSALEYKFGPIFMRLCYELGLENIAAATINDEKMEGFFNDTTSFNIAMNMLFLKGSHKSTLQVLCTMRTQGVPFNGDTFFLAAATCYKINTPESYNTCQSLIEEALGKRQLLTRNTLCFVIALALRQGDIITAQALLSQILTTGCRLCENLKIYLLGKSGSVTAATDILSQAASSHSSLLVKKPLFSQEVVDLLRVQSKNEEEKMRLEDIVSQLEKANQMSPMSLDEMLCYTPRSKSEPGLKMRKISRRTTVRLQPALLAE